MQHWLAAERPCTRTADGHVRFVHNLDFATSGVLLAATSHEAAAYAASAFRERRCDKLYAALVFPLIVETTESSSMSIMPLTAQAGLARAVHLEDDRPVAMLL